MNPQEAREIKQTADCCEAIIVSTGCSGDKTVMCKEKARLDVLPDTCCFADQSHYCPLRLNV